MQGRRCFYVGSDNGILSLAAQREGVVRAVEIENQKLILPNPSGVFEGRDVFAPTAAHLARGVNLDSFGPDISNFKNLSMAEPKERNGKLFGEVVYIDGFGNMVTNISGNILRGIDFSDSLNVKVGETAKVVPFCEAYDYTSAGSPLLVMNSSGFVEVAVNRGSVERVFGAKIGDAVYIEL